MRNLVRSRSFAFFPVIVVSGAMALGGCQSSGMGEKTGVGLAVGSVAGGIIGSQIAGGGLAGALIGAAAGGAIGAAIGASLDEQDRQELARLTSESFETGQMQDYTSPRTGARVRVKIVKTTRVAKKTCRTASQEVALSDGTTTTDTVTACRGTSGWVV